MKVLLTIARKELRATFQSPIALLFLGGFVLTSVFWFFGYGRFFARNIADLRLLFEALPILLIVLVSAITMRSWADEERSGTLEILLTLPLRTWQLVGGKFLAGMALVGIALALTLPLPAIVATFGQLDWGPVFGGYLGALLLASTYMALGLCVSARTDNQVVALMITAALGGALYLIGVERFTALFGTTGSELLRDLGTGSRFESIERGVLDLRDIVYYLGLTTTFLALNALFIDLRRLDDASPDGRRKRLGKLLLVGLVASNALAAGIWMAPVTSLRIDLTADREFSLSPTTKRILRELDEPLTIGAYLSERTHPHLSQMAPRLIDLLAEYEVHGDGRVTFIQADPNQDESIADDLEQRFGVQSTPLEVADRHQRAVVNNYFHVVIEYGDRYQVLTTEDLLEFAFEGERVEARLKSLEYDVTRSIKKVSQDFQSLGGTIASLPAPVVITTYASAALPEAFAEVPEMARSIAEEILAMAPDAVRYAEENPDTDPALAQRLAADLDIRPVELLGSERPFTLAVVVAIGDDVTPLPLPSADEAALKRAITSAIRRSAPGQRKTVGLYTRRPDANEPAQHASDYGDYSFLEQALREVHDIRLVDLRDGQVPSDLDVLFVAKPGPLDAKASWALDQYLMRGGAVVALASAWQIDLSAGISTMRSEPTLIEQLAAYGIGIDPDMVLDTSLAMMPFPTGPTTVQLAPYAAIVDVRPSTFASHPVLSNLPNVSIPWGSPVRTNAIDGVNYQVLFTSTADAWLSQQADVNPDFRKFPDTGFEQGPGGTPIPLAVLATGSFSSHWADRASPFAASDATSMDTLTTSRGTPRLLVIGSNEFAGDLIAALTEQPAGEVHLANFALLANAIDWATEDTDLLAIRRTGALARTLAPLDESSRLTVEAASYILSLTLIGFVTFLPMIRRRTVQPLAVEVE